MHKLIALAVVLTAAGFSAPASAYTQEQQMACQDDAFRVCGEAIPDEVRVRACMIAKISQLSPGCRKEFNKDAPAAAASRKVKRKH